MEKKFIFNECIIRLENKRIALAFGLIEPLARAI